jgi:hypothetical protein
MNQWRNHAMRDNEKGSVIILSTEEEEEMFQQELRKQYITNNGLEETEKWIDSEFNRIFVTYMYPDVTKIH